MYRLAQSHFTITKKVLVTGVVFCVLLTGGLVYQTQKANAVAGINRTINFQGKLINNPTKTNVSNTSYTVVFTFYDRASGGTVLWQETQNVTTADGIFRVNLGSVTPIPASFNFNWDGIYLGMKVGADSEMTPRIQMAAVPYAFNAEKVSGLTVQDTDGNASTSGTLRIANNKTINLGTQNLTFTTSGDTTLTLPSTGTLSTLAGVEELTNKTIGSTGLSFSGATTDISTVSNQDFTITPNGSGKIVLSSDADTSTLIGSSSNTQAVLSVRGGIGNNASFIIDNLNDGDIIAASSSGTTRFRINSAGDLILSAGIYLGGSNGTGQCLMGGAIASWGSCGSSTGINWTLNASTGILRPNNNTTDLILGGTATASAKFQFTNLISGNPTLKIFDSASTNSLNLFHDGTNAYIQASTGDVIIGNGSSDLIIENAISNDTTNNSGSLKIADKFLVQKSESIALAVFDNLGTGDLFTASASGATRFAISNSGNIAATGTITGLTGLSLSSGAITLGGSTGSLTQCIIGGATASWGTCNSGAAGTWNIDSLGTHYAINSTLNTLFGGTSSSSAKVNIAGSITGGKAAMIINQTENQDIFTASSSGTTKFTIKNDGTLALDSTTYANCGSLTTDTSALLSCGAAGSSLGDTLLAVYVVSNPAGDNLTINFSGAANSQPSSSSGTITFPSNASKMIVEARAGGGGGGGTGATNAIKNAGGGGEGGYSRDFINSLDSTYYVKVGGGGNGGAAGGINNGAQGTSTCFGTNASDACSSAMLSASGGLGGAGINSAVTAAGGAGGSATGGDINIQGQSGFASGAVATSNFSGAGGGAGGGRQVTVTPADGNSGSSGGGGSGAGGISASTTTRAGGRGGDGYIIFYIYKSGDAGSGGWNQFASGVLAPGILTTDVLVGGNSTDSAKFGILGMIGNTPIASLSAQNAAGSAIYLDAANGLISTARNATLTLGGGASGNVQINPLGAALFSVGTSSPLASIDLRYSSGTNIGGTRAVASVSGATSFSALVVNNNGTGDLFTASKSGARKFSVLNNGNLQFAGATNFLTTLASGATSDRTLTIPNSGATDTFCLQTAANCGAGANYWQLNSGSLSPFSITADLNLGATSTSSAKISLAGSLTRGKAAAIINQTESQDIFTASASGATKFVISNTGNVGIKTALPGSDLQIGDATTDIVLALRGFNTSNDSSAIIFEDTDNPGNLGYKLNYDADDEKLTIENGVQGGGVTFESSGRTALFTGFDQSIDMLCHKK